MSSVHLENINKSFGSIKALSNLNLKIKDGEFFVLLGPTGAGKTTTLRIISGLDKPESGKIYFDNEEMNEIQPAFRDTSYVFQQYSLYPHYSVYDNLAFPLRSPLRKSDKKTIDDRVLQIARLLKIENKLNNKATQLSGGEMQRVSLGRALVREPNIYLMDEPLSSLDAKLREELRVELKKIQSDLNATILYVTHDQIEATTMADRIGVLKEGVLTQVGTPQEIYEEPNSIYVANRLGSPKINILENKQIHNSQNNSASYIGIRPEDIKIDQNGSYNVKIETTELLGAETLISFKSDTINGILLTQENINVGEGDKIKIDINKSKILYFDNNEQRIV
jgi:multiple sugar transport system ATP-binding protein